MIDRLKQAALTLISDADLIAELERRATLLNGVRCRLALVAEVECSVTLPAEVDKVTTHVSASAPN